jgi:uncharacterized repeat protein (TIGR03806 family)
VPFAGHNLPLDSLPDPQAMTAVPIYPNLSLDHPVSVVYSPTVAGFGLVAEQSGRVRLLPTDPNASTASVFLDLTTDVAYDGNEQGLLGVVLDPDFANNRYFYVDYTSPGNRCQAGTFCTKVVRYTRSVVNPNQADVNTRLPILEIPRPQAFHNGGQLVFGPDGMLYISSGDGGTHNGQDLSVMLASILRIDVRSGSPYSIPADNPFRNQAGKRGEIWDYGLRNPWRFTFDRLTGDLWIGDVGEGAWEEVDYVAGNTTKGINFGWDFCEGTHDDGGKLCSDIQSQAPLIEYPHDDTGGFAVTGGYVYRGDRLPELYGAYIYGDFAVGKIWAYSPTTHVSTQIATAAYPSSFAEDAQGDLVIVSLSGDLLRLQATTSGSQQFPTTLSGTGLFSNTTTLTPAPGLVEYDVNSPLWSDGAIKRRWLALPNNQTIGFSPDGAWTFPVGTAFVKHFELPVSATARRRVETRVLLRQVDRWVGYTYRWNAAQTDATLLTASLDEPFSVFSGGQTVQQTWHYPSPSECLGCHTQVGGRVLGMRTAQLNRAFAYPGGSDNELHAFGSCLGLFSQPVMTPALYGSYADPNNPAESLNARVRSYLASNCAHCHQPGGPGPGGMDMRYDKLLGAMNLIGVAPSEGDLGVPNALRVRVGSSSTSILYLRVASTVVSQRMAKGSQIPDPVAVALFRTWIDSGLATIDSDADGVPDATDNCPYEPNPTQTDTGGWLSSSSDGVGDACQCAGVDSTPAVNANDLAQLRSYLAGVTGGTMPGVEARANYPDGSGRASVLDSAHFKRSLQGVEVRPAQRCRAASELLP